MQGLFITLESTEGAGKGTAVEFLKDCFNWTGRGVAHTRDPGGTRYGESIREFLLNPSVNFVNYRTELYLMLSQRAQRTAEIIRPGIEAGNIVLSERYNDSTMVYQHFARGIDRDLVTRLSQCFNPPTPDITFLMDIDPEIGMARASSRGALDRFELEQMDFFHRVRNGYLTLAEEDTSGRFRIIDAAGTIPEVRRQFLDHLVKDNIINEYAIQRAMEKYDVA